MIIHVNSPAETSRLAEKIGQNIPAGTVIALYGEMGAGKTVFAQGLAKGLGITEQVTSPTFLLLQEYDGHRHKGAHEFDSLMPTTFCHIDAYRLEGLDDDALYETGLAECFNGTNIVLIEWAEFLVPLLPAERIDIHIKKTAAAEGREISIVAGSQFPVASLL